MSDLEVCPKCKKREFEYLSYDWWRCKNCIYEAETIVYCVDASNTIEQLEQENERFKKENERFKKENKKLRKIIADTIWMARRYADGRQTYSVSMVNDAIDSCKELGIEVKEDHTLINKGIYATDGDRL